MEPKDAIYRAIVFIDNRLKEPITIEDAAKTAGYSLFHFIRVFNQLTGYSPYGYMMRRRLSDAALDLFSHNRTITDLAFEYQFNSLETFIRGFKRVFGFPPNLIRKSTDLSGLDLLPAITWEKLGCK